MRVRAVPESLIRIVDCAVALLAVGAAAALRVWLTSIFGDRSQLVMFYPAIMVSAWLGGVWPGVLATVTSAVLDAYLFLDPVGTLNVVHHSDKVALAVFVVTGIIISTLNENLRRNASRENELRKDAEQARADADAANRTKDFFMAAVSHDLRAPMTAVLGWSEMLRIEGLDDARRRRAIHAIRRSVDRQLSLVNDLLDTSAILSGRLRVDKQTLDLQVTIHAAAEVAEPLAEAKHVRLNVETSTLPVVVMGDAGRLQQVVANLLTNGIAFTPEHGEVRLTLQCDRDTALIRVIDTGSGMSPDMLPLVFERFWQAESPSRQRRSGVGLGLSIAKSLVMAHGGAIDAESAGVGKGSTFTVRLPLATPAASVVVQSSALSSV